MAEVGEEDIELGHVGQVPPAAVATARRLANTRWICASMLHQLHGGRVEADLAGEIHGMPGLDGLE